ncbi:acyltransferase [Desulfobaculum bizertense]|uniref:acyltransferase n=1 Tax=Desulfobaculum bizertense TaxID=376490 RepID=UPI001F47C8C7|nr:acyltransferase [Desulfobaculum bizertense]UIJ39288.1 acyltransferase [Desulfobaculum bizertense]
MSRKTSYLAGADAVRTLAIMAVVLLHTQPFENLPVLTPMSKGTDFFIENICRFAVPSFFIISGYFFGRSAQSRGIHTAAKRTLWRVLSLFLFWCLVYAVMPKPKLFFQHGLGAFSIWTDFTFHRLFHDPILFFRFGTTFHLWFFPALIYAILLIWLFGAFRQTKLLLFLAAALYLFGMLGQSYRVVPGIGLDIDRFVLRDGPFFSTLPVALGFAYAQRKTQLHINAWGLILGGTLLQFTEMIFLFSVFQAPYGDYFLGNIPQAIGILHLVVTQPHFLENTFLPKLGIYSPGIYASHILLQRWIDYLDNVIPPLLWQCVFPVLVWVASMLLCIAMSRSKWLKRFVT